jgi:mannose-6-phosphate isomerase-like protein (cupin superfamily)
MDEPVFLPAGEGERIRQHRVLAELPDIESLELSFPADFEGVNPHTHPDRTDSFYVLEGEVEFFQHGEWQRAGPGTFVSNPPNVEHGFRPAGTAIRLLNFHTPRVGFVDSLRKD